MTLCDNEHKKKYQHIIMSKWWNVNAKIRQETVHILGTWTQTKKF